MIQGTPKSLREAIHNGMTETVLSGLVDPMEEHVRDFVAQKFTAVMLEAAEFDDAQRALRMLWNLLFPNKPMIGK